MTAAFPSKWSRRRSCWPASVVGRGPLMCRSSHEFVHLAYFQPVIEELQEHPVPDGYLEYLRLKLRSIIDKTVAG